MDFRGLARSLLTPRGAAVFLVATIAAFAALQLAGFTPRDRLVVQIESEHSSFAQVYFPAPNGAYSEERSFRFPIPKAGGGAVSVPLPSPRPSRVRIDPAETATVVRIARVEIHRGRGRTVYGPAELAANATPVMMIDKMEVTPGAFVLRSTGNDPAFELILRPPGALAARLAHGLAAAILGGLLAVGLLMWCRTRAHSALTGLLTRMVEPRAMKPPERAALFFLLSGFFVAFAAPFGAPDPFCCDAEHYWKLSQDFRREGRFAFTNFDNPLRGYAFPFLIHLARGLADVLGVSGFAVFQAAGAMLWAAFSVFVVPGFFRRVTGRDFGAPAVVAFASLLFFFWRGFLIYPMPDVLCVILVLTAAAWCLMLHDRPLWRSALVVLAAGVLLGVALNMRPVYQLAPALIAIAIAFLPTMGAWRKAALVAALMLGAWLPLTPQQAVNAAHFSTGSPLVQTNVATRSNLYVLQLFFGIVAQRHECGVFLDPAGVELMRRDIEPVVKLAGDHVSFKYYRDGSVEQYLRLVWSHPLDFFGMYARRAVNGVAVMYNNIYQCDIAHPRIRYLYGSLAAWFAGLLGVFALRDAIARNWRAALFLSAPIATALVTIPTAIEARYFLPLHVLLYISAAATLTDRELLARVKRRAALLTLAFVVILVAYSDHLGQLFASAHVPMEAHTGVYWKLKPTPQLITP